MNKIDLGSTILSLVIAAGFLGFILIIIRSIISGFNYLLINLKSRSNSDSDSESLKK